MKFFYLCQSSCRRWCSASRPAGFRRAWSQTQTSSPSPLTRLQSSELKVHLSKTDKFRTNVLSRAASRQRVVLYIFRWQDLKWSLLLAGSVFIWFIPALRETETRRQRVGGGQTGHQNIIMGSWWNWLAETTFSIHFHLNMNYECKCKSALQVLED